MFVDDSAGLGLWERGVRGCLRWLFTCARSSTLRPAVHVLLPGETVLTSWIHVSDIHFGHGTTGYQWDQKLLVADLQRDVEAVTSSGKVPAPRHVFVTGDIAFSGGGRAPSAVRR